MLDKHVQQNDAICLLINKHLRYPKICNLSIHVSVQEDVAWFQIHMNNMLPIQVMYALGYPLN